MAIKRDRKKMLTGEEKAILQRLNDGLFTAEYLEKWINRNDDVIINAPAALSAIEAKGFYRAIQLLAINEKNNSKGEKKGEKHENNRNH